jgi:hypothetical protein
MAQNRRFSHQSARFHAGLKLRQEGRGPAENTASLFPKFPYVCPEPVLVKKIVFGTKWHLKQGVFRTSRGG